MTDRERIAELEAENAELRRKLDTLGDALHRFFEDRRTAHANRLATMRAMCDRPQHARLQ